MTITPYLPTVERPLERFKVNQFRGEGQVETCLTISPSVQEAPNMDANRFDGLTRFFFAVAPRRAAVSGVFGAALMAFLSLFGAEEAGARRKKKKKKKTNAPSASPPPDSPSPPPNDQCPNGTTLCNGTCIARSECCGGCGAGEQCCNGICISASQCCVCNTGEQCCNGTCIPLTDCCGGCGAEMCCAGRCVDPTLNGNCGACGVICQEDCIHGVCTCNAGVDQCSPQCHICATRLQGGNVCEQGVTGTICTTDGECPVGSVCLKINAQGDARCTVPCA